MQLSAIEIHTDLEPKFDAGVKFYLDLGFQIIEIVKEATGSRTWLHLFSDRPNTIGTTVGLGIGIVTLPTTVSFSYAVPSLEALKTHLSKVGIPFISGKKDVVVMDPLGNAITLSETVKYVGEIKPTKPAAIPVPIPVLPSDIPAGKPKRIGILTSGGDSSGMNAAVRSMTRVALTRGCIPYAIYEGYQGLVEGGDRIKQFGWTDVKGFLAMGGTAIGTARCKEFRTREGRLNAAYNLVKNGIDALVVVGGDGSLTGADMFRQEWTGLVDELVNQGRLTTEESHLLRTDLTIVGLVGSIDNDMSATDITIGAVTSLHRICESVDSLASTALSHQRAFVVEVMGRHCGWLALMAAIATGADWVCLPERPPPQNTEKYGDDWASEMCDIVKQYRKVGARKTLVIVCEGAIDRNLNPIKPAHILKVLEERLGLDTRVTTLGHVQRGGSPCFLDRYIGTAQGYEAIEAILRSTPSTPAPMIGTHNNKIVSIPLMEATQSVAEAISKKDFAKAMVLRDPDFHSSFKAYIDSSTFGAPLPGSHQLRIGIIHVGAPSAGMNAATRIATRLALSRGHTPVGIKNGFAGLIKDEVSPLKWEDVMGWQSRGGSELGCNRVHPTPLQGTVFLDSFRGNSIPLGQIAYRLQKHNINALMIIGGFEAYTSQLILTSGRQHFPSLCIPTVVIPSTVSNNVPGTEYSIGSDTALNVIVESCDIIKLSAAASRKRVFVVEVQGGNCGYLATLGGLTAGASVVYSHEIGITLERLNYDCIHMKRRYAHEDEMNIPNEGRLIIRADSAQPAVYTTEVISGILTAESGGLFDSRTAILGHLQQGRVPSPLDRVRAARLAASSIDWLIETCEEAKKTGNGPFNIPVYTDRPEHSCVIGIRGADIIMTPCQDLIEETDFKLRRSKTQWWTHLSSLQRLLAKRTQ